MNAKEGEGEHLLQPRLVGFCARGVFVLEEREACVKTREKRQDDAVAERDECERAHAELCARGGGKEDVPADAFAVLRRRRR